MGSAILLAGIVALLAWWLVGVSRVGLYLRFVDVLFCRYFVDEGFVWVRYESILGDKDVEGMLARTHPECRYEDVGAGQVVNGREELRGWPALEWREALDEASTAGNAAALDRLDASLRKELDAAYAVVEAEFDRGNNAAAAAVVRKLMFLDKLREEIGLAQERLEA